MSLEERFIHGDIFKPDHAFAFLTIKNSVDQQKGVAMRQKPDDLFYIQG
jgi:hypothetical protein